MRKQRVLVIYFRWASDVVVGRVSLINIILILVLCGMVWYKLCGMSLQEFFIFSSAKNLRYN